MRAYRRAESAGSLHGATVIKGMHSGVNPHASCRKLCSSRLNLVFFKAFVLGILTAGLAYAVHLFHAAGVFGEGEDALFFKAAHSSTLWGGISFLVSLVISFRTSQAYSRFWAGCTSVYTMQAEWFDAFSSLVAFQRHSKASDAQVEEFQQVLVRLFSVLFSMAMAEVQDPDTSAPSHPFMLNLGDDWNESTASAAQPFEFELLDPRSLDSTCLGALKRSHCRVELVIQWIQGMIVEGINSRIISIPAPILSRVFQEISNGMVHFHNAAAISRIPFPIAYVRCCHCLLTFYSVLSAFFMQAWVNRWYEACIFCFVQCFFLWALNFTALELENPFGNDDNDLDMHLLQKQMNLRLKMILQPQASRSPTLNPERRHSAKATLIERDCIQSAWMDIADDASATFEEMATKTHGSGASLSDGIGDPQELINASADAEMRVAFPSHWSRFPSLEVWKPGEIAPAAVLVPVPEIDVAATRQVQESSPEEALHVNDKSHASVADGAQGCKRAL